MMSIRRSQQRGHTKLDWLDSHHTFSFDQYYDPENMNFGPLRVINEDTVAPGAGFGTHPHRDMEIITYVLSGELEHKDSIGTGSVIRAGEIQKMSAGSGIMHSEFNHSKSQPVHLLQIWIMPDQRSLAPKYEQEKFDLPPGELVLLGSNDGTGLISIHQDVRLYAFRLNSGDTLAHELGKSSAWLQVARGAFEVNGEKVDQGDAIAVNEGGSMFAKALLDSEALLFVFPTKH